MARLVSFSANNIGALFGLGAFAVFSFSDVVVKQLGATYSPFQIVFFSALLSFPLITLVLMSDQKPGTLRPVHPWWIALRSVSGATSAVCAFYAFSQLALSQVYAIIFASPLIITILAIPMLGETVRLRRGLAILFGLIGVMVVLRPGAVPMSGGHLAALMAAVTGALNSIIVRKIGHEERGVVMILYPMMANLVLTAAILPFVYVEVPIADLGQFAVVAALVLLAMAFLVAAYTRGDAMTVAPMQYSQIVWAALFGALFFGEYPVWQTYLGTAIIALSGFYILKREATGDVSKNRPVLKTRTRIGLPAGLHVGIILRRRRKKV
ncbi:EamA/RhaT family transporter [Sulfitobacter sp. SK012]|uniref:DMT family transporter n=1 Tax=Sulfitobacter sp. SK012 TaxID=1389005 RepID=UPI000E0C4DA0|nr:DMT family transporter [Sulfitobacter sp. SK012]AXI47302.1 EamA/RhaT family transporter [Sulfitobacter sp. SK012]